MRLPKLFPIMLFVILAALLVSVVIAESIPQCVGSGCAYYVIGVSGWLPNGEPEPGDPGEPEASTNPNPSSIYRAKVQIRGWDHNTCLYVENTDSCIGGGCGIQYTTLTNPPSGVDYFTAKHLAAASSSGTLVKWFTSPDANHSHKLWWNGTYISCPSPAEPPGEG